MRGTRSMLLLLLLLLLLLFLSLSFLFLFFLPTRYGKVGLRTLVYGVRDLSPSEYSKWKNACVVFCPVCVCVCGVCLSSCRCCSSSRGFHGQRVVVVGDVFLFLVSVGKATIAEA